MASKTGGTGGSSSSARPGQLYLLSLEPVILYELAGSRGRILNKQGHLKSIRLADLTGPMGIDYPLSSGKN